MKIIQVLNHFLPHQIAGTEVYTWALSKHLMQLGHDLVVVVPFFNEITDETYLYDGIRVIRYAEPTIQNRAVIMGKQLPEGLARFQSILEEEQPDIVQFHEYAPGSGIGLAHIQAAKQMGAKVVMTFHLAGYTCKTGNLVYKGQTICDGKINISKCSTCFLTERGNGPLAKLLVPASNIMRNLGIDPSNWNHKLGTALATTHIIAQVKNELKLLKNTCDAFVSLTEWYKQQLILNQVPENQITLIKQGLPNAVVIKDNPVAHQAITYPIRLIFIGRISAFKGLHLLIDAFMNLPKNKISLAIYGQATEPAYEAQLKEQTKQYENIEWKGKLPQADVYETLRQYDALCLCSTFSEMSPLVIQEAFAANVPVIASNVYGNAEQIVHEKNGLLFKFKDATDLSMQLTKCIESPQLLKSLRANIPVPKSFESVAEQYHDLYSSLFNQS